MQLIAWRNVWRNQLRSLVVVGSIVVGVWALTFALGFMRGFTASYLNNAIQYEHAHLQVHHPGFKADADPAYQVPQAARLVARLTRLPAVQAVSARTLLTGMVSSPAVATGVQIAGVEPGAETAVTQLAGALQQGTFLTGPRPNTVVIGRPLADKLKVKLHGKLVLTFQNAARQITAGAFRVEGIFEVPSEKLNLGRVYVRQPDLLALYGAGAAVHEVAVRLRPGYQAEQAWPAVARCSPGLEVQTWKQLAPSLELMEKQSAVNTAVLIIIIMVALAFGIVNTQLMAVLERTRELGMLLAVGMNRRRVFGLVLLETVLLSLVGGVLGLGLGFGTMQYLGSHGVDLSAYSRGLGQFGLATVLYPELPPAHYLLLAISVMITAVLGALYPARKATRLQPVVALRTL